MSAADIAPELIFHSPLEELASVSPPMVELGMSVERDGADGLVMRLPPSPWLAGADGKLHGGVLSLLADTAAGMLTSSLVGGNATLDLRVDRFADVPPDRELIASARWCGGRSPCLSMRTELRSQGRESPIALSTGTFIGLARRGHQGSLPVPDELPPPRQRDIGCCDDPFFSWIGAEVEAQTAPMVYRLPFSSRVVSHWRLMQAHGGVLAAFLEGCALHFLQAQTGRRAQSIDVTTSYLGLVGPMELKAAVSVERLGGRIAVVRVEAWQQDRSRVTTLQLGHYQFAA